MEIINKTFTSIDRLVITENDEKHELLDTLIFRNESSNETFQMLTNQQEFKVFRVDDNYVIDGEYVLEEIEERKLIQEPVTIKSIKLFEDETKTFIIGFIIVSENKNYHFIRFIDEINYVSEDEFKESFKDIKYHEN